MAVKNKELVVDTGVNFDFLNNNYNPDTTDKQGFVLEGSGGSGKTQDTLRFIVFRYCELWANKNKDILITRETYSECQKTVLKDFINILKLYGVYDVNNHKQTHPQQYKHKGNTISFSGLDDSSAHGDRRHLIYFNELLLSDDDKAYLQLQGRCSEVFIADYNPIFTTHWVYDKVIPRKDTKWFKSTFKTNAYLPKGERDEKLGYEPTPENIKNGTADEYLWRVYGLGLRASREGVIFKHINWITEFPKDVLHFYANDFGYTNDPNALVKIYIDEINKQIFAQELCYEAIESPSAINDFFNAIGIEKTRPIIADSADKYISATKGAVEMVRDLRSYGWNIDKVSKTQTPAFWILKMKEYRLNIVDSPHMRREFENYMWRTINGMAINEPIDKFNHLIDAIRYGLMGASGASRKYIDTQKMGNIIPDTFESSTNIGYIRLTKSELYNFTFLCVKIKDKRAFITEVIFNDAFPSENNEQLIKIVKENSIEQLFVECNINYAPYVHELVEMDICAIRGIKAVDENDNRTLIESKFIIDKFVIKKEPDSLEYKEFIRMIDRYTSLSEKDECFAADALSGCASLIKKIYSDEII